MLLLLY